ncbi:cell growth-regulating nucleolar protein [Aedes aegypti]|uniref:Cell growth-regulating nucleolar protein n=1 Tax=Aedes aegypti TaxID=7159 RepID=A0A903UGJ7_AEDAE|nr:cell growth-regulating nucleolar protein [Aedes aegypti]
MVFFTCNHCGESLKKQAVEKHGWKCKRELNVSCMDCQKDFHGKEYDAHTSCITEAEKYSGKDYVPKANANKGAKKQEAWLDTIRSITDSKRNLSKGISEVFNVIRKNDNIPRKQKGFLNFFANSAKHIRRNDVEAAWALLEEEVKKNQTNAAEQNQTNGAVPDGMWIPGQKATVPKEKQNGNEEPKQNGFKKRKLEEEKDEQVEVPAKKTKKKDKQQKQNGTTEQEHEQLVAPVVEENGTNDSSTGGDKFKWGDVIRSTLMSKNNEMKLDKLKKKVLKKYRQLMGGEEVSDKIERKFSKKLTKLGVEVDNDTVRLIA